MSAEPVVHGDIVVGVDGSDHAQRALAWAIAEAKARGAALHVVTAWSVPGALYGSVGVGGYDEARAEFHAGAEHVAEAAAREAREAGVDASFSVPQGHGADVLVEASRDADLLVVGSRGHGGFVGLLLGSVSGQCAQYAACPVVIVR